MADSEQRTPAAVAAPPPAPQTVGEALKAARLAHDLTLEQVSTELRIEAPQLAALEQDRFEKIGIPVFVKGYLRQYSTRLGLDYRDLLAQYYKQTSLTEVQIQPSKTIRLRDERQITVWVLAAVVLLVVIVGLAVWWLNGGGFGIGLGARSSATPAATGAGASARSPSSGAASPGAAAPARAGGAAPVSPGAAGSASALATSSGAVAPPAASSGGGPAAPPSASPAAASAAGLPAAASSSSPSPQGAPAQRSGAAAPPVNVRPRAASSDSSAQITRGPDEEGDDEPGPGQASFVVPLDVTFEQASWAEISDARGQRLLYELGSAGRQAHLRGEPPFTVVLGNAPGVKIQVDGEDYAIPTNGRPGDFARFQIDVTED
jgi:cytoskeleton protein RodZ